MPLVVMLFAILPHIVTFIVILRRLFHNGYTGRKALHATPSRTLCDGHKHSDIFIYFLIFIARAFLDPFLATRQHFALSERANWICSLTQDFYSWLSPSPWTRFQSLNLRSAIDVYKPIYFCSLSQPIPSSTFSFSSAVEKKPRTYSSPNFLCEVFA